MSALFSDQTTVALWRQSCIQCGIVFAVDSEWTKRRQEDHKLFYCPNGHSQHYTSKSEAEKAREELERERQNKQYWIQRHSEARADAESLKHKVAAERGAKTKLRNKLSRVHKGVCPECNRSFANLKEHMAAKHERTES